MNLNDIEITQVPLEEIRLREGNRHQVDERDLEELAESMRTHGLINPVLLLEPDLPLDGHDDGGAYQCIAGERRIRAAALLNWEAIPARAIPCTVDLAETRALQLVENLQRKDLSIWEEADQVQALLDQRPDSRVEDLADQVGKSSTWVAQRLAIQKLEPELRKVLEEESWPLAQVVMVGRMPVAYQKSFLQDLRQGWKDNWGSIFNEYADGKRVKAVPSIHDLSNFINNSMHLLSRAGWKKDDAKLVPAAGACTTCPKRSSAQALLFPEVTDSKKDRCLDAACWESKQVAFLVLQTEKLKAKNVEPILVKDYRDVSPLVREKLDGATIRDSHDFQEVKQKDKGAKAALLVSGPEMGKTIYVKEWPRARSMPARREIDQGTGKPKPLSNTQRLRTLELKRKCRAVEVWAEKLPEIWPLLLGDVTAIVSTFGTHSLARSRNRSVGWDDVLSFTEAHVEEQAKRLWQGCWPVLVERCRRSGPMDAQGEDLWAESYRQAQALRCVSDVWVSCWKQAVEEVPFPRSLEKAGLADPHAGGVLPDEKPKKKKGKGAA